VSFIIQRIEGSRVLLQEYRNSVLEIGRGTGAQLRSENPSVALEHAMIEASPGGFDVVDRGSITGTYLNGRAIENARLGQGDTIEVGDILITVQAAQPGKPLFLRVEKALGEAESDAVEEVEIPLGTREIKMPAPGAAIKSPRVDYLGSYRLRRGLFSKSAIAIALVVVALGAMVAVFGTDRNEAFRPGDLSVAHTQVVADGIRLIDDDNCVACHEPWGGAPDSKCQACHKQTGHRAGLPQVGSCGDCHAEHRQLRNLSDIVEQRCIDCHRDLRANAPNAKDIQVENRIVDFESSHPEFRLTVMADGVETRMPVGDPRALSIDPNTLKFNHKCHLTGKCNKRPPTPTNPNQEVEKLECSTCHEIDSSSGAMMPVAYEKSCIRCHPLTFDNRFPPVPHRLDLATVAGFIANAYSGNESMLRMSADEVTRVFAQGRAQVNVASTIVRNAQRTLEARCQACHEFAPDGGSVLPVNASHKWFTGVKVFDHRAHLNPSMRTGCVECHARVADSEKSKDLSMPGVAGCRTCHQASGEYAGTGIQTCQTCHYFHELSLSYGEGWTLRTAEIPAEMKAAAIGGAGAGVRRNRILGLPFWAAITLPVLFVVLVGLAGVFVGAARSVASRPKLPPGAKIVVKRPEPAPVKQAPAPKPVKAPPPPEPKPAPPSIPDSTIAMDLSDIKAEIPLPPAGRTVATEYFGSILFTAGILEGRRYTIDAESGCYVGRDRNLADIVIEDARVSRRHVWVGVRDERVVVVDQNSTNGTYLEKDPATRITEVVMQNGDVVILGESAARFRFEG